ncbi:MAG: SoxR reducing system RseC family protein [Eubacteriales bacterium]
MLQRAVVVEINGKDAVIETSRRSMCEGCRKHGGCGGHCEISGIVASNGKMRAEADNSIGAKVGDTVEVETESGAVLGYAALVFIFPIFVCAAFYALFERIFSSETFGYIGAAAGFVLTFLGIMLFDKYKKKKEKDIKIVRIIDKL